VLTVTDNLATTHLLQNMWRKESVNSIISSVFQVWSM